MFLLAAGLGGAPACSATSDVASKRDAGAIAIPPRCDPGVQTACSCVASATSGYRECAADGATLSECVCDKLPLPATDSGSAERSDAAPERPVSSGRDFIADSCALLNVPGASPFELSVTNQFLGAFNVDLRGAANDTISSGVAADGPDRVIRLRATLPGQVVITLLYADVPAGSGNSDLILYVKPTCGTAPDIASLVVAAPHNAKYPRLVFKVLANTDYFVFVDSKKGTSLGSFDFAVQLFEAPPL
jgi:hypothetical protein